MKKEIYIHNFLIVLITYFFIFLTISINAQVNQFPQVYYNGQGTGGSSLLVRTNASLNSTPLTSLSTNAKIGAETYTTSIESNGTATWAKVCLPSTDGTIKYGYMMYGQSNIRINEINNCATVTASPYLFIRPCPGCTSTNVTLNGQNASYGQNSIVALTGSSQIVSGIVWYEVYLTTDCSSPTGWLSSGINSSFLFINSNTNNYYNVAGTVKNDNDVLIWGANINIGSWPINSTEGFYQYKVPQNWTGLISCSHQSYNTSSPTNYSHTASSHNYSRNFQLSNGCTYSISPSSVTPTSSAGSGSVSVTATSGCSWTAISNNTSWLSITSSNSGNGNGTVNYSFTSNPNPTVRIGTISIADKTFTLTQAALGCNYSISPGSIEQTSSAGMGSIVINADDNCPWTVTSNHSDWLTITSGNSGTGNGNINFSFTTNPNATPRTGTITVSNFTFTFIQQGNISQNSCVICDTKAWNTPFGDCASGHTDTDLIEWPSKDIEVQQSAGYLPDDLASNPTINRNDARPRSFLNASCDVSVFQSYDDQILTAPNGLKIIRRWSVNVLNNLTGLFQTSTYTQTINVNSQNSCSAPTIQANNILFTSVSAKQMTVNWNNGNGSRRIIKINTVNSFTSPLNGISPSANSLYTGRGEQIVYNGSSDNVTITGLSPNTTYWIRIYEANCTGSNSFYNFTTSGTNPRNQNTTITPITGTLTVSGNLNFGNVPQGSSMDKAIILQNNTSSVIKITGLTFSPSGVFRMSALQNDNIILPGKLLPISVVFIPPSVGTYSSSVTIKTDIPNINATFSVTGTGVNIQPSWVGIYNELENNPELSKRHTLSEYFINSQSQNPLKICADGSKATVIKFSNTNQSIDIKNITFRIKSDPNGNNTDYTGWFLVADYKINDNTLEVKLTHPKYLNVSGLYREDVVEIINTSNGSIIHEIPIQIYRAPVVLLHGLWGNWTNLLKLDSYLRNSGKYNPTITDLWDYKNTNALSFSNNRGIVKDAINNIFEILRGAKYSSGKVDIVAHSMGGILSRLYLQNEICKNGQTTDCYRNDINKLITLNTPHSGTQAANYLLKIDDPFTPCVSGAVRGILWLEKTLLSNNRPIKDGAINDLRCDSDAIKSLNGSLNLNKNIVPSYAIATYALLNKTYTEEEGGESFLINSISKCRRLLESRNQFLLRLFDNDWSDYIVPEKSQIGGLKDYSPFPDILHTKSHQDESVQKRVLLLLEENPNTSTFFDDNRNGFNPPTLQPTLFDSPDNRTISSKRSNLFIDILSPQDNTTFNVGESAEITINAIPQSENVTLVISNDYGETKFVELNNSNTFSLPLDMNLCGNIGISALITSSEGKFAIESVTVNVLPSQLLDSLRFINDEINIPLGQTFSLSVAGFFNEQVIEMNRFPQIQYIVDNPYIVKINALGVIESMRLGSTFIKASFQGLEAFIKINVYDGFDWVNGNNCTTPGTPTNISASVSDDNITLLTWSPGDPSGSPNVRYNWVVGTDSTVTYGSGISQGTTSNTGVSTNLIPPGGTYYLRVNAFTDCDNSISEYGTSAAFNTVPCTTPGTPFNAQVVVTGKTSANLSWQVGNPKGAPQVLYYWVIGTSPNVIYGQGVAHGITNLTQASTSELLEGTTYYLRVFAKSDCNNIESQYATSLAFRTDGNGICTTPGIPNNIIAVPTGQNTANLSWISGSPVGSQTVTYYWVVGISPDVTYGYGLDQGATSGNSTTTSLLTCNTNYYLRVYAQTSCNNTLSTYGTSSVFKTSSCTCTTPGAPVTVSSAATGPTTANLDWSAGNPAGTPNITYYWVVGTNPSVTYGNGAAQGSTTGFWAGATSLLPGTTYYLRVYASTSCNNSISEYGTSSSFTTNNNNICVTPGSPVSVFGSATGPTTANLDWSAGNPAGTPNITYYWVVGTSPSVTYGNGIAQGSSTNFWAGATGLLPGTTYYLRVYARTSCNNSISGYSTSSSFTTNNNNICVSPGSPVSVSGSATGQTTASLDWSAGNPVGSPNITYYWVVGKNPFVTYGNGVAQGSTTGLWAGATGLIPGTTYYLRVYASTSCNNSISGYGTSYSFTTNNAGCKSPILQSNTITFSLISTQQFIANWTNGNGSRRVVKINTINSFTPPTNGTDPAANPKYAGSGEQVVYNGNGSSVTITGLKPNQTYWVRVYEANCDGINSVYNTTSAINNPNSQSTRTVLPSVQSFTASNVIFEGNNIIDISPIFFTNKPYDAHPPIDIYVDGNNKTRFALNASYAAGFSFQLVDHLTIVTDGTMAINPAVYGSLEPVTQTSNSNMYMDYLHPAGVSAEPYLDLRLKLLFEGGLVGMSIPVHIHPSESPLPVELTNFSGQYNKLDDINELTWTTKSEVNNDYFDIERSFEREAFRNIGKVNGIGNSSSSIDYIFNDRNIPYDGTYIYRLKQVDMDGKATVSKLVSVIVSRTPSVKTGLFPNPSTDIINCYVDAYVGAEVNIDVFNSLGQLVSQRNQLDKLTDARMTKQLECKAFGKGIFTVVFTVDGIRYNHKLIIIE
jgi:pimeloyl-ACP methyl ester carboxylesterase